MSDPRWLESLRQLRLRHDGKPRAVVIPDSWLWLGWVPAIKGISWIPYLEARWEKLAPSSFAVICAAELHRLGEEVLPFLLRRWNPVWGNEACVLFSANPGRRPPLDYLDPAIRNLLRFSLQLKRLREASCLYRSSGGLLFQCRHCAADIGAIEEAQTVYFEDGLARLPERAIVVDAGAHIGGFTIPTARRLPKGRVFAFEPDPGSFALLRKNLRINKILNATSYRVGLSSLTGKGPFFPCDANPVLSTALAQAHERRSIKVSFTAMSDFLKQNRIPRVDLLKVDIEGGEYDLLMSRSDSWLGKIRRMIVEVHGNGGYARLSRFLKGRGLSVGKTRHGPQRLLYATRNGFY